MTSTQVAQTVLLALWVVATMILTSAQLRVMKRQPPRRRAYLVAWLICATLVGGLLTMTDRGVGVSGLTRLATNFVLSAAAAGLALAAGSWMARRPSWSERLRALRLFFVHAIVVLIIGYAFI